MAINEPLDPRVRLAISQWPEDAPRGAVSTFCAEHGISRKSFYALRKRARAEGPAAVLEPRTRRPRSSPSKLTDEVKAQAVAVRAALEASGLDHGPISVHDKMRAMGLEPVPSTASLARIFREAGVARLEPKKKPRSAWRRFVYPAPNACWQLDATEYVLAGGRKCVIFQLIDDHSRYAVASHVAVRRDRQGRDRGRRQGDRRSRRPATTAVRQRARAEPVAARVSSANSSRTLPRWASRRSPASPTSRPPRARTNASTRPCSATSTSSPSPQSLAELQAQVDAFDHIYNTERPHQGLPGRITPPAAWEATPKADPPRPKPDRPVYEAPAPSARPRPQPPADLPADTRVRTVTTGTIRLDSVTYKVDVRHAFEQVLVVSDGDQPRSSSPTSTARSSPSTPDPHPASNTSATADPAAHAPTNPELSPKS